jgi:hypothetical protein
VVDPSSLFVPSNVSTSSPIFTKVSVFWDISIAPCSPLKGNRCCGGTCRVDLQGWRAVPATCFLAAFLLCLFFDPEDWGDMFLRKVGWPSTDYAALYLRRLNSS